MAQNLSALPRKKIGTAFYRARNGREPVRDWLLNLRRGDRRTIGKDIQKIEFGWPIGMPYCSHLRQGCFEARSNISDKRIARVIFFIRNNEMVLLHGFVKKSQATQASDLNLALRRKKEVQRNDKE